VTTARASLALAFALGLTGCSGPLVGADLDEPKICFALRSETVPAPPPIPPGSTVPEQTVTWSGDLDIGSSIPGLSKQGAVTGNIYMLSLSTIADPAGTDLSGITSASVAVTDAAGTTVTFMHYARPSPVTTPGEIDMVLDQNLNLLDELEAGVLHYSITFKGLPPPTAWTADIETCLSAHLTIDALKALQ
jgi:hypothetical protein